MSSLLPDNTPPSILTDLELPALNLTATTLTELAAADMTAQEREFFGDAYITLPDTLSFSPGLSLAGRLPLDALGDVRAYLGYRAGSEAVLSGTLGANVTLSRLNGSRLSLRAARAERDAPRRHELAADAQLGRAVRADHAAVPLRQQRHRHVVCDGRRRDGRRLDDSTRRSKAASRARGSARLIGFTGTINNWRQPFGVTLDQHDRAGDASS